MFALWLILLAAVELKVQGYRCPTGPAVPDPVAFFPLTVKYGTKEIKNRVAEGVARGVRLAPGPDGKPQRSYEFAGNVNSYIEFSNTERGPLDVRYSMTMLCWVYHLGQDGPLFNYKTSGPWGVHLWANFGQLFVRFTKRNYHFTQHLGSTPLAGGWKFVGASYDGSSGEAKLWVNGEVVQTLNIGAQLDLATQDNIRMGVKIGDGRFFKGRIAQMQVYNKALSKQQIVAILQRLEFVDYGCTGNECQSKSQVPDPIALYPLNAKYGTREINNCVAQGVAKGVRLAPGPDGKADGSYEFAGNVNSYIEFPNTAGGPLDVRYSITMLCWVYHLGQDGPLFNYKTSGYWGVHLWANFGQLFVRFTKRNYHFTQHLGNTPLAGGWKFVGASYDGSSGEAKLWVNGEVVQILNIGAQLDLATQDNIRMGVKIGDGRFFNGRIAQMQVYNKALSQQQIKALQQRTQVI